jgi:hypothetical protein
MTRKIAIIISFLSLKQLLVSLLITASFFDAFAQETAIIKGTVCDENNQALSAVVLRDLSNNIQTKTNDKGYFEQIVPANKNITLEIFLTGWQTKRLTINLKPGEIKQLTIALVVFENITQTVEIKGKANERTEVSTLKIDPKLSKFIPSPFNDFNKILNTLPGVTSNSELSSTYGVRGGNYDENLVYVNGMEVYRPFLVRSGQQEGLSFVNQDLVSDIEFSSGGWKAKYGDKLSSVLNIKYKEPKKFEGSFSGGLLGGTAHIGGKLANNRMTYIIGGRNKSSQYLLNSLPVQGQYLPKFYDIQSYLNFDLSKNPSDKPNVTTIGVLMAYARNRYSIIPSYQQTSFGTSQQIMTLNVSFDGQESLEYDTYQGSAKFSHLFHDKWKTDFIVSAIDSREREYTNVEAGYRLSEQTAIPAGQTISDQSTITPGLGTEFKYARNRLHVAIMALESKNVYTINQNQSLEFGFKLNKETIEDVVNEYSFLDSADYVDFGKSIKKNNQLSSTRYAGYVQHTYNISEQTTFTSGVRLGYWTLNNEWIVSPRVQLSHKPKANPTVVYKFAAGIYNQQPFYREMRDFEGNINTRLKSQKSIHYILGSEKSFKYLGRNFKFTSEFYYKYLYDVVPYDIDNVRLRYYAVNNAVAYATGADFRVSGEFIKGEESWFSLGILRTREKVEGDDRGYIRRPSDQLLTLGVFFQDHLPNNPSIKMYFNGVYGSGFPFGVPDNVQYRQALDMPSYKRVDIGMSKMMIFDENNILAKYLHSIWLGIEILNVIGANNTISYLWVKDVSGNKYAVPNTLSQRFFNARLIVRF